MAAGAPQARRRRRRRARPLEGRAACKRQIRDPGSKPSTLGAGGGGAECEALCSATYATTRALRWVRGRQVAPWGTTTRCCAAACMPDEGCAESRVERQLPVGRGGV